MLGSKEPPSSLMIDGVCVFVVNLYQSTLCTFLLLCWVHLIVFPAALALNCVCDYSRDACTNDSCRVDFMFHQVHCDVAVGVYLNGTIKSVVHSCIDDFVHNECRTHPSPSDDGTFYSELSNHFL